MNWQTELDEHGCALMRPLLTPEQCREISGLYDEVERFRSTIDMARYRFGSGQYRYFDHPLPTVVAELRESLYPQLLPIARDWAERLDGLRLGRTRSRSGSTTATARARRDRRRSCSGIRRATGTPCTATCTATWCFRCRW